MTVTGLVLAAGEGRRMGTPKALLPHPSGDSFLGATVRALRDGGCDHVVVVTGASSESGTGPVDGAEVVHAADWRQGMSESLAVGLRSLEASGADAALVMLVDLPDVGAAAIARVLDREISPASLARAAYGGRPGHPVLLGRDHWAAVVASADQDRGARDYLAANPTELIECGDLASGLDVDTPADLGRVVGDADASGAGEQSHS